MEFIDVIRKRYSVREYTDTPVPDDKIARIIEVARLAPSGNNRQPWKFIVVKDPVKRRALGQASNGQDFIGTAPVIIAAIANDLEWLMPCGVPGYGVDLAIAAEHIVLAAADEGLGSCWIGDFSENRVKEILAIPELFRVFTILPIGYPAREGKSPGRKAQDEIVCLDTFK